MVEITWKGAHREVSSFFLPSSSRSVPNRYTFPCPYCPEKNFDQEGLVEHCKLSHSTDTKSVVREKSFFVLWVLLFKFLQGKSQTVQKVRGLVNEL